LWGDERWRLFSPFELVWAGGATGRVAGYAIGLWGRGSSAIAGRLARHRQRVREAELLQDVRLAEQNRLAASASQPEPSPEAEPAAAAADPGEVAGAP
jgi:hypothetical protein